MSTHENPDPDELGLVDLFDATNGHLSELPVIPASTQVVDLTCNRLTSVGEDVCSNLLSLTELQSVSFRQNLLKDVQPLSRMASAGALRRLELRDNQIDRLPDFALFSALEYLECSYNHIGDMGALESLPSTAKLRELYLAQNHLRRIDGLASQTELREVELGHNKIKSMCGLEGLTKLAGLWLGSNRIARVDIDMSAFTRLTRLALTSNRLTSMEGLEVIESLEELYVSDNGIVELCDLSRLRRLRVLDVASNKLTRLDGVGGLGRLTDLWANGNEIDDLDGVEEELSGVKETLETLYLHGNAFMEGRQAGGYRLRMTHALPKLVQLDDTLVHR